jgi:hypothetical protein
MCMFYFVFCPFVLFHLTIVLSVLPPFKEYDYLFGILKLFFDLDLEI